MSRFVTAGGEDAPNKSSDAWAAAQAHLEALRNKPKLQDGKQEGGKSLYEVLQANKAEKEKAHEEAMKLTNQFRALDDDELDFLDSVDEKSRQQEAAAKKETAEELRSFRKQQQEAEKQVSSSDMTTGPIESTAQTTWQTKKRRRKETDVLASKVRKTTSKQEEAPVEVGSKNPSTKSNSMVPEPALSVDTIDAVEKAGSSPDSGVQSNNLGLGAYGDSDTD